MIKDMFKFILTFICLFFINTNIKAQENCINKNPEVLLNLGGSEELEKIVYSTYDECKKKINFCDIYGCSLEIFDHEGNLAKSLLVNSKWFVRPVNNLNQKPTYEIVVPVSNKEQKVISIKNSEFVVRFEEIYRGYRDNIINNYRIKSSLAEQYKANLLSVSKEKVIKRKYKRWIAKCFVRWQSKILIDDEKCVIKTKDYPIELFDDFSVNVDLPESLCEKISSEGCFNNFVVKQYRVKNKFYWSVLYNEQTINSDIHLYIPRKAELRSENGSCFIRKEEDEKKEKYINKLQKDDKFCFVHDGFEGSILSVK